MRKIEIETGIENEIETEIEKQHSTVPASKCKLLDNMNCSNCIQMFLFSSPYLNDNVTRACSVLVEFVQAVLGESQDLRRCRVRSIVTGA